MTTGWGDGAIVDVVCVVVVVVVIRVCDDGISSLRSSDSRSDASDMSWYDATMMGTIEDVAVVCVSDVMCGVCGWVFGDAVEGVSVEVSMIVLHRDTLGVSRVRD